MSSEDDTQVQQQKKISVELGTFFSADNAEKQNLKVSIWNGKIGFEFFKMKSGSPVKAFTTVDYEKGYLISGILTNIARERAAAHRNKSKYSVYDLKIEQTYPDKEGTIRNFGTIFIKTVQFKGPDGKNNERVAFCYENKGEMFQIILCSSLLSTQAQDQFITKDIDVCDVRFFYFCKFLENVINNLIQVACFTKQISIMFRKKPSGQFGNNNNNRALPDNTDDSDDSSDGERKVEVNNSPDIDF